MMTRAILIRQHKTHGSAWVSPTSPQLLVIFVIILVIVVVTTIVIVIVVVIRIVMVIVVVVGVQFFSREEMPFIRETCRIVIFITSALTYAEQPAQKAGEEVVDGLYIDGGGHQLAPLGIFTANLVQKQIHEDLLHCLGHIGYIYLQSFIIVNIIVLIIVSILSQQAGVVSGWQGGEW